MVSSNDVTITELEDGSLRSAKGGFGLVIPPQTVAALRAYFAAERMPEDVQELVIEATAMCDERVRTSGRYRPVAEVFRDLLSALEAAYSQRGSRR